MGARCDGLYDPLRNWADDMSGEFTEHADIRYTTKELLHDIRSDVRAMNVKLELKADREAVHKVQNDIAAIRLEQERRAAVIDEFRREQTRGDQQDQAIARLEKWRSWVTGSIAGLGIGVGLLTALSFHIITNQ